MCAWDDLSELEQLQSIYSDASKDAYGFRDRSPSTEQWNSVEWLKEGIAEFSDVIARNNEQEKLMEQHSIERFEAHVADVISKGAKNRATALRWIADECNFMGDWDYVCYDYGLPYGYFKEAA